jgi:multidrug efflux pump subunit AcrB
MRRGHRALFCGEDRERSLVKLHNKIAMNIDQAPPLVKGWVIKPVEIDDVPIVNLTLYSDRYDDHALRRIGEEVLARLAEVKDTSRTFIVGGRKREVRVELVPEKMAGRGVSKIDVLRALQGTDASVAAGAFSRSKSGDPGDQRIFLTSAREVEDLVVSVHDARPVYLRDIATVLDGPEEAVHHARIGFPDGSAYPAVTLALAKKKGSNAVDVAADILQAA